MSGPQSQEPAQEFQSRLFRVYLVRECAVLLAAWALTWGTLALVLKEVASVPDRMLGWGCLSALPVLILAGIRARRRLPSNATCRAALDQLNEAGGLVMAQVETDLHEWASAMPRIQQPDVTWQGQGKVSACFVSCLFVGAVFLLPRFDLRGSDKPRLDIRNNVEELELKIQTLEEAGVLEEQQRDTLRDELMKAWKESSGDDPVKTWETLDHVEKSLDQLAQDEAEDLLQMAGKSALTEELTKQLEEALKGEHSAADSSQALREMAAALDKMGITGLPDLPKDLADSIASLHLSEEQLAKLAKCMSNCTNGCSSALNKMAAAKLIDPSSLQMLDKALACNQQSLAEFLKREGHCEGLSKVAMCNTPGDGGTSRGRGDAPMTWTDPSSEADAKFKEKSLAPSGITTLEKSQLTGMSLVEPTPPDASTLSSTEGALSAASASGGSANTQPLLPKHKSAVTRYFEREQP